MRKWNWQTLVALAVALAFLSVGCGEDKPPAPIKKKTAEEEQAQPGKEKSETGEQKKTEEAAAPGKEPAPAATTEGEVQKPEEAPSAEEQAGDAARAEATRIQLDRTLRKVTAYGVTGPIATTRDEVISLLPEAIQAKAREGFDNGLKEMATEGKLKNMDWLDLGRGIGFAFEGKDKPLIAIPVTSIDAFKAALPEAITADENNGYAIDDSYIMPYGKYIFLTDSYRTFELIEGDLKLELTRIATDKTALVVLGGESLKTLVSSALDEFERGMSENMPMQQEQKEFLAKLFNFLKELLGEIDQMTVTLDLAGKDLVFRYELKTMPGSRLAQSVGELKPGNFVSAGYLPTKSYFVMAQNFPAAAATPYMNRYVDLVATAWKLKEEERGEFAKLYAKLVSMFGPDAAFALYSDSSFPMAMSSVTQTRNGIAARDQIYAFYTMVLNKVIEELPPDQRQIFASGSLKQVVDSFAPVLLNLGVGVKMDTEDYRGGKVDYLVMTFDWDKLNLPPSAAWIKQIVRSRLGGALAFSDEYMVFTFGPNPIVRAKEILDKTPGLKVVEFFGPGVEENKYFAVVGLSVERLLSAVLEVGTVAALIGEEEWVAKVRQIQDLVFTAGILEGGFWLESTVGVRSIIQAFEKELIEEIGGNDKPAPAVEAQPPAPAPAPAN